MAEFPVATSPAPGVMGVDWENRVDFERLRQYRIGRVRQMLEEFDLGAVLLFETSNIRYATATQIGYWAFNKGERWALITRTGRPRVWDFGSAAKAHRLQLPHMYDTQNAIGGNTGLQGAIGPETGLHARAVREIKAALDEDGVGGERLGVALA
jgi:Xaa-Pro aminopeptidase